MYAVHTNNDEHHYEEPKEKEPKEKNMRVFYKLNLKDNVDLSNIPYKEEYTDENCESIEEQETTV